MDTVTIEKDIYVRDQYNVRRTAFVAGMQVSKAVYDSVVNEGSSTYPDAVPSVPEQKVVIETVSEKEEKQVEEPVKVESKVEAEKEPAKAQPKKADAKK